MASTLSSFLPITSFLSCRSVSQPLALCCYGTMFPRGFRAGTIRRRTGLPLSGSDKCKTMEVFAFICIYCRETGKDEQVAYLAMKRLARAIRAGECAGLRTLSVDLCDCEVVDDVRCFVYGSMDAFPPTIVYSRGRLWNSFLRNRYGAGRNMQSLLVSALACGGCPNLVSLELLPCRCDEESALAFASAVGSDPPRLGNLLQMTQEKASGDTKTRGLKLNEHLSILRLPRDFANSSNEEILACVRRRRRTRMVEDIFSTELSRDVSRCVASYGT